MKWLIVFCLVVMLSLPVLAYAGEPVINHIADAFSGKNDYIETWGYVAKTIDLEGMPFIGVLNADLRIKASTPIGENSFRKGILEVGLEF